MEIGQHDGRIQSGSQVKCISVEAKQRAEIGIAGAYRFLQNGLKDRLQFTGDELITLRTSDVAVCWSSDSLRSAVRWRSSLSNRAFSMAMTA